MVYKPRPRIKRPCHNCGELITQGKFCNGHKCRQAWGRKLENRGVLPIKEIKECKCGRSFRTYLHNRQRKLCDHPECKKSEAARRMVLMYQASVEAKNLDIIDTGPYLYGTDPVKEELRQRVEMVRRGEL